MDRPALSPKKLIDHNIPCSSPLHSCPSSPTKSARISKLQTSPRKIHLTPLKPSSAPGSPRKLARSNSPLTRSAAASRKRPSPLKVYSSSDLYNTKVHAQLLQDEDLVLMPPQESRVSPSPTKRKIDFETMRAPVAASSEDRIELGTLSTSRYRVREQSPSPFDASENAFLTPPRPRIGSFVRPDDHLSKSASPKMCDRYGRIADTGFTIFVDRSIYYATFNAMYDYGEDVNKENDWKSAVSVS